MIGFRWSITLDTHRSASWTLLSGGCVSGSHAVPSTQSLHALSHLCPHLDAFQRHLLGHTGEETQCPVPPNLSVNPPHPQSCPDTSARPSWVLTSALGWGRAWGACAWVHAKPPLHPQQPAKVNTCMQTFGTSQRSPVAVGHALGSHGYALGLGRRTQREQGSRFPTGLQGEPPRGHSRRHRWQPGLPWPRACCYSYAGGFSPPTRMPFSH